MNLTQGDRQTAAGETPASQVANDLAGGGKNRDEALPGLGLPPGSLPDQGTLRARFRMLATIHHPDGLHGNHKRMSQLNAAMELLVRGAA